VEDSARLEALGVELATHPHSPPLLHHLAEHGRRYGLVILTPYSIAYRYLEAVREHAPQAACVYLALDLGHLQLYRHAKHTGNIPELRRALEAKQWEIWLARNADVTLMCSELERESLLRLAPGSDVRVASHVVEPRPGGTPFSERRGLMFLGSFPHQANVDAVQHLVRDILPEVRHKIPGVTLRIVGSDPPPEVEALAGEGITVTGRVPCLEDHFARSRVLVAPLRWGAGIKIKVLESLGHGLPVVLSSLGAEGLHLTHGTDALIADEPQAFAAAVVRLHADENLWRSLRDGGFRLLERRFSLSAMESVLAGVVELARSRGGAVCPGR
jgi:glycosyltransferase involved in cell wall biosynthesis